MTSSETIGESLEDIAEAQEIPIPLRGYADVSDDEGPWARKTVLCFDGGGVRGYSSLLILKRLMMRIQEIELAPPDGQIPAHYSRIYPWMGNEFYEENEIGKQSACLDNFLPCHYFDYISGTSTGGLSAIMLGRLRMSVDDALKEYAVFGNAVFGKPRWFHERWLLFFPRPKFSTQRARAAFQNVVFKRLLRDSHELPGIQASVEPFKSREERTRTIAISRRLDKALGVESPYMFRSYHSEIDPAGNRNNQWLPPNPGLANTEPIWQVACATSAAPTYFKPVLLGHSEFIDGGLGANNPSLLTVKDVHGQHLSVPELFLSIGTGKKEMRDENECMPEGSDGQDGTKRRRFRKYIDLIRHVQRFTTDTEGEAGVNGWHGHCHAIGLENRYRLNVEGGLSKIPLDDWRPSSSGEETMKEIREATEAYLNRPETLRQINEMAQHLVKIRRKRAETERWEAFAVDVVYYCREELCPPSLRFLTRHGLRKHLKHSKKHHTMTVSQREAALNRGRRVEPGC
ncbi:Fc.00g075360.m01.CDS01 [Cosmosporella sp. VM-42]